MALSQVPLRNRITVADNMKPRMIAAMSACTQVRELSSATRAQAMVVICVKDRWRVYQPTP